MYFHLPINYKIDEYIFINLIPIYLFLLGRPRGTWRTAYEGHRSPYRFHHNPHDSSDSNDYYSDNDDYFNSFNCYSYDQYEYY